MTVILELVFRERADPHILAPTDAIIRLTAACNCGSDPWQYRGIDTVVERR